MIEGLPVSIPVVFVLTTLLTVGIFWYAIAIPAFPSSFQMVSLDQPNVGVTYFPFVWLPAVIVPIVFFCHAASLWKLIFQKQDS